MSQQKSAGAIILGSDFKALGVIRSLGQRGIPCIVIDNLPRAAWFSRYAVKRFKWPTHMDDEEFITFLLSIGKKYDLADWVLFPMQDEVVQLIACNTVPLAQIYRLVTQDTSVIRWANDKRLTYHMAEEVGVPYPKTTYITHEYELATLDIPFPVIVKPAISVHLQYARRLKALPASTEEELYAQYESALASIPPDEAMIQEIIPGNGGVQYSIATFCEDGSIKTWMTARRKRQYPIDFGLGSSFVEAVDVPDLLPLAEKLLRYMRVSGMVEVEFKYDERDQQYKLLDINVRPWGWHTLCMACGLDFPYMQYCWAVGDPPPELPTNVHYGYHWVRTITDIPAAMQEIRAGVTSPLAYLKSLRGKTAFSVLDWRDLLPTFGDAYIVAARVLRGRLKRNEREVLPGALSTSP